MGPGVWGVWGGGGREGRVGHVGLGGWGGALGGWGYEENVVYIPIHTHMLVPRLQDYGGKK